MLVKSYTIDIATHTDHLEVRNVPSVGTGAICIHGSSILVKQMQRIAFLAGCFHLVKLILPLLRKGSEIGNMPLGKKECYPNTTSVALTKVQRSRGSNIG